MTDNLCDEYNLSGNTRYTVKNIFQNIYDTPTTFLDGAEKTLGFLNKIEIPIGIVTHANRPWTYKKYQWLDLQRFLNWDDIFIVDENIHKTSGSWQDALNYFHLQPQVCAVIGDSPRSDINPAIKIGVKHCFLVKNPIFWSVHQQPTPLDTPNIENIFQLIQIGTGQL